MSTILGIESTAHTFGIGIVKDRKIISNKKRVFTTESGGMIPIDVAKFHAGNKHKIYYEALDEAGLLGKEDKIDAIAFSQGPGLAPCLREGKEFAKELSKKLNKPLVPVNHCVAHLEIGKLTGAKDPVLLYASGANTQIIAYSSGKYRIFGETLDMGIGNFIDSFAREAGIGFPGGPKIEKFALEGKNYIELPYVVKGMDISLSGIFSNLKQKLNSEKYSLNDLAFSLQEIVFAMLVEVSERALAHTGKKELLIGGGVGCNTRLREMCEIMCKERGAKFFTVPNSLLVDNGAMIAYTGEIMFKSGIKYKGKKAQELDILPRQRTDDVLVMWK
ncbi:UGMP family protein [Candidatus Pacearchaeota archaeon CG10_big_fil_rev_8_21_14_0_10_32_14]|nr:MAG: UGMP family protein [Candidatus Pacearchaeota archaeon CG10_big_fil_rev_8_21_14_0_10_32_14]